MDGHFGQPPVYNPQTKDGFHLTELTHPPRPKMFGFAIYTSIPSNCQCFKKTTFLPDVHCRISTNHNLIITYKIFFEVSKPIESHYEELPSMSPGHRHDHTDPGRPGLLASVLHRHRPGQAGTPGEETCGIHDGNHVER